MWQFAVCLKLHTPLHNGIMLQLKLPEFNVFTNPTNLILNTAFYSMDQKLISGTSDHLTMPLYKAYKK